MARASSWSVTIPRGARRHFRAPRVRPCEQPRGAHDGRALRRPPQSRHGDTRGVLRRSRPPARRRVLDRAGGREAGRRTVASTRRFAASRTRCGRSGRLSARSASPLRASWLGERELDLERYEHEFQGDSTCGFMLARREALAGAGLSASVSSSCGGDRPVFSDQPGPLGARSPADDDPSYDEKAGANPRRAAQDAFSRRLYSRKHFSPIHRWLYVAALLLGYVIRGVAPGRDASAARLEARRCPRVSRDAAESRATSIRRPAAGGGRPERSIGVGDVVAHPPPHILYGGGELCFGGRDTYPCRGRPSLDDSGFLT